MWAYVRKELHDGDEKTVDAESNFAYARVVNGEIWGGWGNEFGKTM